MELKELGERIVKLRNEKGLSAYELSLRIGKDTSYMYKVESGKVNLSFTVLQEICEVLEVELKELLD